MGFDCLWTRLFGLEVPAPQCARLGRWRTGRCACCGDEALGDLSIWQHVSGRGILSQNHVDLSLLGGRARWKLERERVRVRRDCRVERQITGAHVQGDVGLCVAGGQAFCFVGRVVVMARLELGGLANRWERLTWS
jgi:hypothetical protein